MKPLVALGIVASTIIFGMPNATAQADAPTVSLTIYSSADPSGFDPQSFLAMQRTGNNPQFASQVPGFGIVRDIRTFNVTEGVNVVRFVDVAQFIDPTTVSLVDLSVPAAAQDQLGLRVLEQQFQFDLVSPEKLLEKYVDQPISVNMNLGGGERELVTGTLLSTQGSQLVLQTAAGLRIIRSAGDVMLGTLPEGLITRPTLVWRLIAPSAGERRVQTAYQTSGLTWRADYNLVLNADDTAADISAWVTTLNLSGVRYENANLKLIAGDVQRVQPREQPMMRMVRASAMMESDAAGFEEKAFFEYHMYTLPRPTTIENNSTQQIALFPPVRDVTVEKVLVYQGLPNSQHWRFNAPHADGSFGRESEKKVDVFVRFENKQENRLGIPLPSGKIRVFKADAPTATSTTAALPAAASLEFVGEDLIDHTARNEKVLIRLGQSFDVTGERVQLDFKTDGRARWIEETVRMTMRNAKQQPQRVVIRENLYRWTNWEIIRKSDDFEKIDSRTIHFNVDVPADGSHTVTYTVKYTW